MKTQIIALEAHDDFISVRDRMSWAKSPRILLVWPKYEKITLRGADLRILQQHAATLGAEMGIITRRGDVRRDAERFGIPVFGSAKAAQRQAWSGRPRMAAPEQVSGVAPGIFLFLPIRRRRRSGRFGRAPRQVRRIHPGRGHRRSRAVADRCTPGYSYRRAVGYCCNLQRTVLPPQKTGFVSSSLPLAKRTFFQ